MLSVEVALAASDMVVSGEQDGLHIKLKSMPDVLCLPYQHTFRRRDNTTDWSRISAFFFHDGRQQCERLVSVCVLHLQSASLVCVNATRDEAAAQTPLSWLARWLADVTGPLINKRGQADYVTGEGVGKQHPQYKHKVRLHELRTERRSIGTAACD